MYSRWMFLAFLAIFTVGRVYGADSDDMDLMGMMYIEEGWEQLDEREDGLQILQKKLPKLPLHAIQVRQRLDIDPQIIANIVENVDRYEEVVVSANTVDFIQIEETPEAVFGYQYYHIPLMKNRHLVFSMVRTYIDTLGVMRTDWSLLPRESRLSSFVNQMDQERKSPVYLYPGYGSWQYLPVEKTGEWEVSYRLYIDPGGWLPDFIVDYVNRAGLANLFDDVIKEARRVEKESGEISWNY